MTGQFDHSEFPQHPQVFSDGSLGGRVVEPLVDVAEPLRPAVGQNLEHFSLPLTQIVTDAMGRRVVSSDKSHDDFAGPLLEFRLGVAGRLT